MIPARAAPSVSESVSKARAWTFGRIKGSNGKRAGNGSNATNARSCRLLSDPTNPLERRELVRHAPNRPARSVWPAAVSIREDLRRRHRLVAFAERAALFGRRIFRVAEGAGALRPGRREDHPGRRRVILADFRHGPAPVPALDDIEDCARAAGLVCVRKGNGGWDPFGPKTGGGGFCLHQQTQERQVVRRRTSRPGRWGEWLQSSSRSSW